MSVKYINFDLSDATSEDYNKILKRIFSTYPNYKRPLNTTYYIATMDSCDEIFQKIVSAFPFSKSLIVGGHENSHSNLDKDFVQWLKDNT